MATIKNSAADLAGKTLLKAEDSQPVKGLKTFLRAPLAPFGVEAGSAVVPNLDADLLDGEHGADYHDATLLVGTVPATCLPDPLPARSAENLVNIPAANLTGPVPAASLPALSPVFQTVASTGTVDDLALNDETTDLLCTNASALVLTGLAGGSPGRRIWVHAAGAGQVNFTHEDAGSDAENRFLNFATVGQTSLAAGSGTAAFYYDGTTQRWRLFHHEQGAWISPPYNAGDFYGSGAMTWGVDAGDVQAYQYRLSGRTCVVSIEVWSSNVGGTPDAALMVRIPAGLRSAESAVAFARCKNGAAAYEFGYCRVTPAGVAVEFRLGSGNNWSTTSGNNTFVQGQITFEVR